MKPKSILFPFVTFVAAITVVYVIVCTFNYETTIILLRHAERFDNSA